MNWSQLFFLFYCCQKPQKVTRQNFLFHACQQKKNYYCWNVFVDCDGDKYVCVWKKNATLQFDSYKNEVISIRRERRDYGKIFTNRAVSSGVWMIECSETSNYGNNNRTCLRLASVGIFRRESEPNHYSIRFFTIFQKNKNLRTWAKGTELCVNFHIIVK